MAEQLDLERAVALIDPIRDLASQADSSHGLAPRYASILRDADELLARHRAQPGRLGALRPGAPRGRRHADPMPTGRLLGMLTDLFIDFHAFKGANFKARVPDLLAAVEDHASAEQLVEQFCSCMGSYSSSRSICCRSCCRGSCCIGAGVAAAGAAAGTAAGAAAGWSRCKR